MFSRSKAKETKRPAAPTAASTPGPSAKRAGARTAPSIISSDLVLRGNLVTTGDIQIDGNIEGNIRSQSVTIGEKASVNGEIIADDIAIRGRVVGTIRGRRVQLCSTCHVEGEILHETLAVETGAFFEGSCRHSDDPIGHAPAPKPAPRPAAAPVPPRPAPIRVADAASHVVVGDGGVIVKRPAAHPATQ